MPSRANQRWVLVAAAGFELQAKHEHVFAESALSLVFAVASTLGTGAGDFVAVACSVLTPPAGCHQSPPLGLARAVSQQHSGSSPQPCYTKRRRKRPVGILYDSHLCFCGVLNPSALHTRNLLGCSSWGVASPAATPSLGGRRWYGETQNKPQLPFSPPVATAVLSFPTLR